MNPTTRSPNGRHVAFVAHFVVPLVIGLVCTQGACGSGQPNVLVILADDLGYGDLACFGAKDLRSPNIDRLASQGILFDHFYANCCVCSPTRAALLSGKYPDLVGVPGVIRTHAANNWGYLAPSTVLLPKLLAASGYDTAIVGKWHLGLESPNTPNERGFGHFHGFLGDMMDDYYNHLRHGNNYMRLNDRAISPQGHATDLFSDWASEYLRRQNDRKPFFLYLAYNAPHTPIQPPEDWIATVKKRQPGIDNKRARLVALIEHMDAGIGKVLATLEETGLDKNTLVIFSSDNGGQLSVGANNGPLRDGKQSNYEGGLRVPMLARWPGRIKPATRSNRIAVTMDLFPTILEAAGVTNPHAVDGDSVLATLLGESRPAVQRELVFMRREGGNRYGGKTIHALRRGDWKLVHDSPFAPMELYNLQDDPREQHDLSANQRGKFNELAAALRAHLQRAGAVPWQKPGR